jgi:hypothetical protein
LFGTDYNAACQFGDCQAGAASQYPVTFGFTTIPVGFTQMVVSSNAVQGNGSHVQIQDDPGSVSYFGGFPAACNTAQFLEFKILAKQGPLTAFPAFTEYPTEPVTSSSFSTNVVTLVLPLTTEFAVGNIVRHAGDSSATGGPYSSGLNTLGWITGVTNTTVTTITYSLIYGSSIASGTGGTLQIVPGFVVVASTSVSTTVECLSFTIFD